MKNSPLDLTFVFKTFQSVQAVNIVAYKKQDMGIQVPSLVQISIQGVNGENSDVEEIVADSVEERSVEEGPTILSFPLNISMAGQVKLLLHFSSKWILLSEVFFLTQPVVRNIEQVKEVVTTTKTAKENS